MDELLSLKWNNHKNTFFDALSSLFGKETYSDVTLACEGKFYPVHKLVLSTCSDYFKDIFEKIPSQSPVVILKDIGCKDLRCLLKYMYIGEVEVNQSELPSLIKVAECLQVKGLAVSDHPSTKKRLLPEDISPPTKRKRKSDTVLPEVNDQEAQINGPAIDASNTDSTVKMDDLNSLKTENLSNFLQGDGDQSSLKDFTENLSATSSSYDKGEQNDYYSTDDELAGSSHNYEENSRESGLDDSFLFSSFMRGNQRSQVHRKSTSNQENSVCCHVCGKKFVYKSSLNRHLKLHSGEHQFQCPHCNYSTTRKDHMQAHMKSKVHADLNLPNS